jgi:thiol:disulfide interchange protein
MQPIVNGLQAEFGNDMAFLDLDAADNADGQQAFEALSLPGHPSYVIYTPAGEELHRAFGVVSAASLQNAIENALNQPLSTSES